MKIKTPKTVGTTSAAPIVAALLAGVAVGAVAYAKRKELAAAGTLAAKKLDPVVVGTKNMVTAALDKVQGPFGTTVVNFGALLKSRRELRAQALRNPETFPQHGGESLRAVS